MIKLFEGDCLEVMKGIDLKNVQAVISDVPYGGNYDCDYTRFTGGEAEKREYPNVIGDDKPFDPTPWMQFDKVILWGYQHFSDKMPLGTILVWLKKRDSKLGKMLSDAELAWQKGGQGVYVFRHIWDGFDKESERGIKRVHPTQKPIELMRWCIKRITKPGDTVFDPYMGSGTTGVACVLEGRNFVGVDLYPEYVEIASKRIQAAQQEMESRLF